MRSIKIIADAGNKTLRTVYVSDSAIGLTSEIEQCLQVSDGVAGEIETVQTIASPVAGVKNIYVDGYVS